MERDLTTQEMADLDKRFAYHKPVHDQPERYTHIRQAAGGLAHWLMSNCPASRELSLALTHLEETVMWANASIARNEPHVGKPS